MKVPRRRRVVGALLGAFLALGAPAGAIFWRVIWPEKDHMLQRLTEEWNRANYLYIYMTVGVFVVFTLFGWFLGNEGDALSNTSGAIRDTFETLNLLAITDGLTGIYNHRYLQERIALEIESADRYGTPLTCMMLDIDDFKTVNDTFGHPFGDLVLMTIARLIRESLRRVDLVGRYGGEEFCVVMPHTSTEDAHPTAERIRSAVEHYNFSIQGKDIQITLSIGMATSPSPGMKPHSKQELLSAADTALYQAKQRGKNKTVIWHAWENLPKVIAI